MDYILVNGTVFDLKDVYLSIACVYMIVYAIKNSSSSRSLKDDIMLLKKILGLK
ncbi:hypothetical protein JCM21531_688 [Acetivibrio straminisolvens JCM 21531]|uniref:Uncharacterized protein n=1 Tax=Acetivibrio straminisolvens JCM 21531 TaxID=1294263 RepID=W4V3L9_9FIRM|nr:hypothetical protein JCM21531_688 [Acetivibrio straminisolvens JCM 21531]